MRKQHVKCGHAADRLGCRISINMIKMDSQPWGGTIANTVCVFTAMTSPGPGLRGVNHRLAPGLSLTPLAA